MLPQRAVQVSNCDAGMCVTLPIVPKRWSTRARESAVAAGVEVMTVVEERTKDAVLGMARTMVVGGKV